MAFIETNRLTTDTSGGAEFSDEHLSILGLDLVPDCKVYGQVMEIVLQYFEGCPNWRLAYERLQALCAERSGIALRTQLVESDVQAQRLGFHGSPSIVINGVDRFTDAPSAVGLSCRRYTTPEGIAGAPTMEQLRTAVEAAEPTPR